jgi:peptide chain release factor subunit 3
MCHIHTCVEEATLADIIYTLDKKTGCIARKKPRFVRPDEVIVVRMVFARPVCVERFADFERFGRIVLRSDNKTVAFGKILAR